MGWALDYGRIARKDNRRRHNQVSAQRREPVGFKASRHDYSVVAIQMSRRGVGRDLWSAEQRSRAQRYKQVAVGLRGLPRHIEMGVFGFDQPLPDL